MNNRYVSTRSISKRNSAGVGYIVLPVDIDRNRYIASCYRKGTLSIVLEDGGHIDDVLLLKESFDKIVFPESSNELGSLVFWVNIPKKNQPVIIGTISKSNEFVSLNENEFSLKRESKFGFVEISGNGKNTDINVIVNSNQGRGKINIIASNTSATAELNVKVKGDVNVYSSNDINLSVERAININVGNSLLKIKKGQSLTYIDQFGNEIGLKEGEIIIKSTSGKIITIDDKGGIIIDATETGNVEIKSGKSIIELSEQGVSIDVGDKELWLNGNNKVLYAKSEEATVIQSFEDIGISESTKVGL